MTKIALACGVPVTLASGQAAPRGLALDGTGIYWTNLGRLGRASGEVMRLAR